jgi:hypothetical protein
MLLKTANCWTNVAYAYTIVYLMQKGGGILKTVTLRLPKSIHGELLAEAKNEGISLNQLCLAKLAKPLSWYADLAEETKEERR